MNEGITVAKGEFIRLLNNDVSVRVHWDKNLIEAMEMVLLDIVPRAESIGCPHGR
jgi:hypothetical protein